MNERLAIDVKVTRETGLFGKRADDRYSVTGKRITRLEFNKEITGTVGRGDAFPVDTELPDVVVHYWLDMFSKITYTLKVWVED